MMDENIKGALQGLGNSLEQLHSALEQKFNKDEETIHELKGKVIELEDIAYRHNSILNAIANAITEGMRL